MCINAVFIVILIGLSISKLLAKILFTYYVDLSTVPSLKVGTILGALITLFMPSISAFAYANLSRELKVSESILHKIIEWKRIFL